MIEYPYVRKKKKKKIYIETIDVIDYKKTGNNYLYHSKFTENIYLPIFVQE